MVFLAISVGIATSIVSIYLIRVASHHPANGEEKKLRKIDSKISHLHKTLDSRIRNPHII